MRRPGFTLLQGRNARLLLITLPALLVLAAAAFIILPARRALTRAALTVRDAHQLAFTLQPVDLAATHTAFEPVASTPNYTTAAFFAGQLYLAGPSGLSIFNADGSPQITLRTGIELPVSPITALVAARIRSASEPQVLAATAGAGLLILQPNPHAAPTIHQLLPADSEARDLTAILPLATGDLLLGTRHRGVLLYNGATLTSLPAFDTARLQITALAAVDAASYLIGTRNDGVFYVHAGTVDHADTTTTGLPDNQIESIALAPNQSPAHAYIGTSIATADFDLTAPTFRPTRTLAQGLFAHTLAADAQTLTIGTLDQGIQQIPLTTQAHLRRASISNAAPTTSSERIDALLPTSEALYAIADGTLIRRTESAWQPALPPAAATLTDRNISALAFAPDGTLYIGFFDRGLDELRPDATVRHLEDDHLFCINRLALDPARQTIAAATANGLVLFDAQGTPRQTLLRRDGLISDHISDIAFTPAGTALATPAGITFLSPTGAASLYAFQGLINNHVYALAASPAQPNQLLAGTLGGLSILESEAVQRNLTVTNSGLKHNWITALLPTPSGDTLIGTYGASLQTIDRTGRIIPVALPAGTPRDLIINPNALYATPTHLYAGTLAHGMLAYNLATQRWTNITQGLPSLNVTAFAARAGTLYIGTENGLVRIPEANLS